MIFLYEDEPSRRTRPPSRARDDLNAEPFMIQRRSRSTMGVAHFNPVKLVRKIPALNRLLLTVRAGGRCEFNGHNKYLFRHSLTLTEGNFSQAAHICQRSPKFPPSRSPKIPPSSVDFALLIDLVAGPVGPVGGAAVGAVQGAVGNAASGVFHSSGRVHRPFVSLQVGGCSGAAARSGAVYDSLRVSNPALRFSLSR